MQMTQHRAWPRRFAKGAASLGALATVGVLGVSAASSTAATTATDAQASSRALKAGKCSEGYSSARDLTAKQQLLGRTPAGTLPDGVASEPDISRDSRSNRFIAYTSTATNIAAPVTPGKKNVFVVQRTGTISPNANAWQVGGTRLVSDGQAGPGDGDSFGASISGYTGANDAAKGPDKVAFLSTSTNLAPGGNPTGTSAFVTGVAGGSTERINAPGTATGVGISGDSKVIYVTTTSGLYVRDEGKLSRIVKGGGLSNPSTTLNGKQVAYQQGSKIFVANLAGGVKFVTNGVNPSADGGDPQGGPTQGFVRAIGYQSGGSTYRVAIDGKKRRIERFGKSTANSVDTNVGGSAVVFGNGAHACVEVRLLDSTRKRGGYDIPQGACPDGQGTVTDVALSSRYNYLAFTCSSGGLYLHYVGEK
jgi:hypothetical protein